MKIYREKNATFTFDESCRRLIHTMEQSSRRKRYRFFYFLFLGRDYEKDKVCKELANLGKDDFASL